ncbi:helix-turn-helix domain-containing protein [Streptomyces sp. NBC_00654]|uniref:PucR family transcriptional regulator n=1 Tax=Streptomyces sp. NBC_00654 TaxID=2975799 RepID=UPI00225270E6|nr:helix-turn-helix domain-containing protein [Streptomyces sp. NBC_00654]MCX4967142.1 helix-turn-helix domain-containing protein [Streptomyces sp. NBC_00654]
MSSTAGTTETADAAEWDGQDAVGRLLRAATRSGADLISEAASVIEGWAVLADPIAGAVYSTPATAAADGVHTAAAPREHPHRVLRPAAGAVLVLAPAPTVPADRTGLVLATTAALLEVRARRAAELLAEQMRLHTTLIRLLLAGHTTTVTDTLGGNGLTHVTVYRLTGPDVPTAHQVLWRAARPSLVPHAGACTLMGQLDAELVVAELHRGGDDGRILRLVSRVSDRHSLIAGMAGPVPLTDLPTAHSDAAAARHSATATRRIIPATATGTSALIRLLPPHPYTSWATTVLDPVTPEHRHLLDVWLRTGTVSSAAGALGLSAGTVRARLGHLAGLLGADLPDASVRAYLLLALRAPTGHHDTSAPGPFVLGTLPAGILDTEAAHTWATGLIGGLEPRLRIALACWVRHHGKTAPAATELHLHRTTLTTWLNQCTDHLGQNLDDPTVRTELYLALEATRTRPDDPAALPRRGGRTYRRL